jgi:uncharacterized protein with HEPN domain
MKHTAELLQDMMDAIASIETYKVTSFETFLVDEKTQDAIMFNLIVLGEAANRLSEEFREYHPDVPWASIIGTRNVIVHGYDQVKLQIVWDVVHKDLDSLKDQLFSLL